MQEDICKCPCHTGNAMHITACCVTCPKCGEPIVLKRFREHTQKCTAVKSDNQAEKQNK